MNTPGLRERCADGRGTRGAQSLYPEQFSQLMDQLRIIAPAVGRTAG